MTPSPPPASDTLNMVSFMAGGRRYAVEAAQVRAQSPVGTTAPATQTTVEQLLELPGCDTQNPAQRRILLIKHAAGDFAVTVSTPVELRSLKITAIHPPPPLIKARCKPPGIRGLAMGEDGVTVLIDLSALHCAEE